MLGILGAFLAVPVAAIIARIIDLLRGRPEDGGDAADASAEAKAAAT